jgi:hypothetical protein
MRTSSPAVTETCVFIVSLHIFHKLQPGSALDAEDPVREPSIMILPAKLVCILALLKPVSHTAEGNIAGGVTRWM